jgi:hypothetical protein
MTECATTTMNLFAFKISIFEINEQKTPNVPERLGYVFTSGLCHLPFHTSTGRTKVNYTSHESGRFVPGCREGSGNE